MEPEELAEQGRQAAKKEESPMAGTVASSSAPGTGGRVASEAVLIAGPPPMAAPDWAPDAEDEMAKQKNKIKRKFKTKKIRPKRLESACQPHCGRRLRNWRP